VRHRGRRYRVELADSGTETELLKILRIGGPPRSETPAAPRLDVDEKSA
jgi:hypothetical protein